MSFLPQPFPPHNYEQTNKIYEKFEEEYYLQDLEELLTSPEFHAEFFFLV